MSESDPAVVLTPIPDHLKTIPAHFARTISELQRKTDPWARGKVVRVGGFAEFGVAPVSRREIDEWVKNVVEEQMRKGKRK